jgi:hypothetical protein
MAQSVPVPPPGFDELSTEQQLNYVHALWDRIVANSDTIPVPEWHRREIENRLAHPSSSTRPWSALRAELVAKYDLSK